MKFASIHSKGARPPYAWRVILSCALGIVVSGCSSETASSPEEDLKAWFQVSVMGGGEALPEFEVTLFKTGAGLPMIELGRAVSDSNGIASFEYRAVLDDGVILYATASGQPQEGGFQGTPNPVLLSSVMRPEQAIDPSVINERTTVAMAFSTAQFLDQGVLNGSSPGLQNAVDTAGVFVNPLTGQTTNRLHVYPNGDTTRTEKTFNSLANLLSLCVERQSACETLFANANSAYVSSEEQAQDTLQALLNIAHHPSLNVQAIALPLSTLIDPTYRPTLQIDELASLGAWTLALRYVSQIEGLNAPGNVIFDEDGNAWIANNYTYGADDTDPVCGGKSVFKLTPTGQDYFTDPSNRSPYFGGGVYGVGFGITLDPSDHIWVGNFGFQGSQCSENLNDERAMSVSQFNANSGVALSPSTDLSDPSSDELGGWDGDGTIDMPQGTYSDSSGNIWVANCGGDSITRFNRGNPEDIDLFTATDEFENVILHNPFDLTLDPDEHVWATSNDCVTSDISGNPGSGRDCSNTDQNNGSVYEFNQDGEVVYSLTDSEATAAGLSYPIGIASDSAGNIWVANSGLIPLPCSAPATSGTSDDSLYNTIYSITEGLSPDYEFPGSFDPETPKPSVTLLEVDATEVQYSSFQGGGIRLPWGINVDGKDNVWVANFEGQRVTHLCGAKPENCPPGFSIGQAISPEDGYQFDGLLRNTNVSIDPSGNVWLSNNWKIIPAQVNPGGNEVVVFIGLAAPVQAPHIGAPPPNPN